MNRDEAAEIIRDALQNRRRLWRDDPHFVQKLDERGFTVLDAVNALKYGRIERDPSEEDIPGVEREIGAPRCIDVRVEGKSCDGKHVCVLVKINPAGHCILWTIWSV